MFNPGAPFELAKLPPGLDIQGAPNFMGLMESHNNAQRDISELNGMLREAKNPGLFLESFYLRDSVESSAIENIHTTVESVLEDAVIRPGEGREANKEVLNYKNAIVAGQKSMKRFGLSSRTIKKIHQILNVKNGVKGEFRRVGNSLLSGKSVIYTPPRAALVDELLGNWERFACQDKSFFPLIRVIICHYQFEAIHPFLDGNGRTGRILMVLQLVLEEMLDLPVLFISGHLSQHDRRYKELLLNVTAKGNWWEFIQFMLDGFSAQAKKTKLSLGRLKTAHKELRHRLYRQDSLGISKSNIAAVVEHIFFFPITHAMHMASQTNIHWQTCSKYLQAMEKKGILSVAKSGTYKIYKNLAALDALRH